MKRKNNLTRVAQENEIWDLAVIGGGASGLGVALDALSRGLKVLLLEKSDFAKGTSSRSTKLVHGGVRYLAQGEVGLVLEALKERGRLLKNAPHLTVNQPFIIPLYTFLDRWKYSIGLKIYDWMAGSLRLGKSRFISKEETVKKLPEIRKKGLKGGVVYHDGQFDDARLALIIAKTCDEMGGCLLNYAKVNHLSKDEAGIINGLEFRDLLGKKNYPVKAKTVVNATGVFADKILQMDNPGAGKMIQPSQGVHLVVDARFLGGKDALMIPSTSDGRVLFAVPWQGKLVLGTTDTIRKKPKMEPQPLSSEIDFILETASNYLDSAPKRKDVLSVFAGLRPLAAPKEGSTKTKEISRSHKVIVSESKLITITGGKWTTFRKMGEDTVEAHYKIHGMAQQKSTSAEKKLHGYTLSQVKGHLQWYGSDAARILQLQKENEDWATPLLENYPYTGAEVVWAVREEMAQKIEDFLSRRCRILLLDAKAAMHMAPKVAAIMAKELGKDEDWIRQELEEFYKLAKKYLIHQ
ncbi:glycerol-3-phosphate dehydrogenase/oxidase [Cyclobacterium plantarum]|uniref:Glycerol-3-phosphate dehydrogenase/oxidase n=1 Tax=Cyclobacterium plantarum TaxID=2716263 RepID=A0ABX0HAI2_9BACT|nr:glycerol-3-phosphate dehydrogenase/oxidase [Cyclobacterium plantarum]NHE58375.1 glycerol-3-phosphate dehydrogenase/oxidase [Cyclobacterium plantarum]